MIPYLKQIKDEIEKPDNGVRLVVNKLTGEVVKNTPNTWSEVLDDRRSVQTKYFDVLA